VPLLFVSLPGLLALINAAPTWRGAALRGLVFGIAHHLVGLYWITEAILVEAADFWWAVPLAVPLLAAVLAVFIAVPCGLARLASPGWPRVLVLAGAWELGDIAREFVLTGFPWNPFGSAWEMPGTLGLAFMQPAAWVGVGGLTLLTLLVCSAPALGRRPAIGAAVALAAWGGLGFARLQVPAAPAPDLMAVLVQGDISETDHRDHWRDRGWIMGTFDKHLALTRQGVAKAGGRPAIVVWPETASPYWLQQDASARQAVADAAGRGPQQPRGRHAGWQRGRVLRQVSPGAVRRIFPELPADPAWRARLGSRPRIAHAAYRGAAGDRSADLLRGDFSGPGRCRERPAGAAREHYE
jgi:apolipoprotein N-acyltransferase